MMQVHISTKPYNQICNISQIRHRSNKHTTATMKLLDRSRVIKAKHVYFPQAKVARIVKALKEREKKIIFLIIQKF